MFTVTFERYTLLCQLDGLPDLYTDYAQHARLVEEIELHRSEGKSCFIAIRQEMNWPSLVVAQRYSPAGGGFHPGVVLIPETGLFFLGAGERLLAYQREPLSRLWQDQAEVGFRGWQRHGRFVLMAAELELAAWDWYGRKLWATYVEPPWEYTVERDCVRLDVMGRKSSFPLITGPTS